MPAPEAREDTKPAAPKEPLCDGSDALRLVFVVEGGGQTLTPYYFTEPHGHVFFAVDGKCRYYAEDDYMRGVVSGMLTPEETEQLSADMHWNELDSWVDLNDTGGCADASNSRVIKPHAAVGCFCSCEDGPIGLTEVWTNSRTWRDKFLSEGKPLDGPVAALIATNMPGGPQEQPRYDWPLERAIEAIPDLLLDPKGDSRLVAGSDQWARFDDPAEIQKLRELRAKALKDREGNRFIAPMIQIKAENLAGNLYVRDELPDGFDQKWKALRDSAMPTK